MPGARELERRGNTVLFSLQSEADALVKALARERVVAIDSHEADLEDIFLNLYRSQGDRDAANVFLKTLLDARRALIWWSLGLVGLSTHMIAVYPTVRDNPDLNEMVSDYPEALKAFIGFGGDLDYVSGAGYLGSELFAFMVPLLLLIAAIGAGARAIAGEEERGTLDLLLANPLSRRRLVLDKLAAVAVEVAARSIILIAALVVGVAVVGMNVTAAHLAAATMSAALLAFAFGAVALLVGAYSGHRGIAIGVAAAGAVAAYLVNSLAALVTFLEPARAVSPFYHYVASDPLRQGSRWITSPS